MVWGVWSHSYVGVRAGGRLGRLRRENWWHVRSEEGLEGRKEGAGIDQTWWILGFLCLSFAWKIIGIWDEFNLCVTKYYHVCGLACGVGGPSLC